MGGFGQSLILDRVCWGFCSRTVSLEGACVGVVDVLGGVFWVIFAADGEGVHQFQMCEGRCSCADRSGEDTKIHMHIGGSGRNIAAVAFFLEKRRMYGYQ